MRNFKDTIIEKLKVSANNTSDRIKTTLRKFMAWYTGKDEWRINRYDLEERNFMSDKSMSLGDKMDFLYKHMNDTIYMSEEEKLTHSETGLSGMTKSKLYDYSFEIDGITFSINARIYGDDELLSNNRQYIITEKLKVSNKDNGFVPFNSISIVKFARALRKTGTVFIENYTDELISDKRYARKYNEMYLYSIGLKHPSEPYPMEIEFEYRTKDKVGTRRDIIKDEEDLQLKHTFAEGGDFQSLIENIYNDIM